MTEILSASQALEIVDNCPFPLLLLDAYGRVTASNRAFDHLVGASQARELQGCELATLANPQMRPLLSNDRRIEWADHEGRTCHFEIHSVKLPGDTHCRARFFVDISRQLELERAHDSLNEELKQHILTDTATGLLNQRGVMLALEPQVARSRRYNSPISVIMLEVDSAADGTPPPVEIARVLKDQLRWADLVGCTERQEFILVLPETSADAALKLADKLKSRIQRLGCDDAGNTLACKFGITSWNKTDNATSLLKRAAMELAGARAESSHHSVAM